MSNEHRHHHTANIEERRQDKTKNIVIILVRWETTEQKITKTVQEANGKKITI